MNTAGIKTVSQFRELGWQRALKKLIQIHPRYRHTIYAVVLIGALQDKVWHQISEADKKAARDFVAGLSPQKTQAKKVKETKLRRKT